MKIGNKKDAQNRRLYPIEEQRMLWSMSNGKIFFRLELILTKVQFHDPVEI